jgi:hypothetical protein
MRHHFSKLLRSYPTKAKAYLLQVKAAKAFSSIKGSSDGTGFCWWITF